MFNFLTIGYDCSTATALKNLNLRTAALPFDWVQSNINSIQLCFQDNFAKFHTNLKFNHSKTRLIDEYGFQFPHDYPFSDISNNETLGEGIFTEEKNKSIVEYWMNYYSIVKEKYDRRIKRFLNIVNDTKPIIVLCRYNTCEVLILQKLFLKYYNNNNIIFINSSSEVFSNTQIYNCYTEKNGIWNDISIWKEYIDMVIDLHKNKYTN
jgi:hypothetical protein